MPEKSTSHLMNALDKLPMLSEAVAWELLRKWSLSEVWRVTLRSGESIIAKCGTDSMAKELEVYQSLLIPLNIRTPEIYASYEEWKSCLILMEDLGPVSVEKDPTLESYEKAARKLAEIREWAQNQIQSGRLAPSLVEKNRQSKSQFIKDLHFILGHGSLSQEESETLHMLLECFPPQLDRLYKEMPLTLSHNDYNGKNLMIMDNEVIPIDWSNANLSPHLGDLYSLVREANENGYTKSVIKDAFLQQNNTDSLEWQIQVGGLCWLIQGLTWVCKEGKQKVPGTEEWISPLIAEVQECLDRIE
ncbi:MAG TPA: phosphotransferase [Bacillales bacterium]|nr:phosphotransferase [Bacillales bacterium]